MAQPVYSKLELNFFSNEKLSICLRNLFCFISALLIGVAISFFIKGTVHGGVLVSILSAIMGFMGIGAAWHTFGRANSIDKPAFEKIGYRWPGSLLLWTVCIIGAFIGWGTTQELSGIIYFGFGIGTYGLWFLLTFIVSKMGLIPDREVAHREYYGTDRYL